MKKELSMNIKIDSAAFGPYLVVSALPSYLAAAAFTAKGDDFALLVGILIAQAGFLALALLVAPVFSAVGRQPDALDSLRLAEENAEGARDLLRELHAQRAKLQFRRGYEKDKGPLDLALDQYRKAVDDDAAGRTEQTLAALRKAERDLAKMADTAIEPH